MKQPILVEFVGMMGSGKSSIARLVIDELNQLGYKCPSLELIKTWMEEVGHSCQPSLGMIGKLKYRSSLSYLIAACRFPLTAFWCYRYALSVRPLNRQTLQASRAPMNWLELLNKYVYDSPYDIIVFEEGMIQYTNSIALHGEEYSQEFEGQLLSGLLKQISTYNNYVVIFTKIDAENVIKRLRCRANESHRKGMLAWKFEKESEEFQRSKVTYGVSIFDSIAFHLQKIIPNSFLEIDTLVEVNQNVKQVVEFIEKQIVLQQAQNTINQTSGKK